MYQWVVFVHILAAIVWIGGMLFLALVLVPTLRGESPQVRAAMMSAVGRRFRTVGWLMILILLGTGVWNLHNRHFGWSTIFSRDLFRGPFGHVLAAKLAVIGVILALSAYHDFVLGPASTRAGQAAGQGGDRRRAERLRRTASWIGRANALLALVVIWLAVALVRGLPW